MIEQPRVTLWLVRHGQTDWNVEGRYQGHTDRPLNPAGLQQAHLLAERLPGQDFAAVYASDLLRARQTAEIVAARWRLPVTVDPRLREIHQGDWEGMLLSAIASQYAAELAQWRSDPETSRPPGGESIPELSARLRAAANEIALAHPGERVLVVSHGLSIAALLVLARRLPLTQIYSLIPPNGEPVVVEWEVNDDKRLQESQQYWDQEAANFDDEPDHGLRDPIVFDAWISLLKRWFPPTPAAVLDVGCGTGTLSAVLAGLGYQVTGIDLSPAMINVAKAKTIAQGLDVEFQIMDAAFPALAPRQYDAIICRHLLWTLPEPEKVLQRWTGLLKPNGKLILVEGYWGPGGGLHRNDILPMLPKSFTSITSENLSEHPALWGKMVTDERYAIIAGLNNGDRKPIEE